MLTRLKGGEALPVTGEGCDESVGYQRERDGVGASGSLEEFENGERESNFKRGPFLGLNPKRCVSLFLNNAV